jgi:ketosteroid isomerase-like protein
MTTQDPATSTDRTSRARRIAEAHFTSEVTNDVDVIMRTMVAGDFLATAVLENPPEGRRLVICRDAAEQHEHYRDVRQRIDVVGADLFTSFGGTFYGFVHGIVYVDVHATGERRRPNELIAVLPIASHEEAIIGEIGGSRPVDAKGCGLPDRPPLDRVANLNVYNAWLAGLRNSDIEAVADHYHETITAAIRMPGDRDLRALNGIAELRVHYDELFASFEIEAIDEIARLIDCWYVFTELEWTLRSPDGTRFVYRSANALILGEDDRLIVDIGYGTDLEPA